MTQYSGNGGTDGANMVMFWPENLPEEADTMLRNDPISFVDTMREEGRVIWFYCDGDGQYAVTVFLDEDPPGELRKFMVDEEVYPDVRVQGTTYFGGLEYMYQEDDGMIQEFPGMCNTIDLPEGTYQGAVYRTDIPAAFSRQWLMQRMGTSRYRILHWQQLLSKAAVFGAVGVLFAFFFLVWYVWLVSVGAVALTFVAAVLLARSESCREAIVAIDEFTETFPEYVVVLSSQSPASLEEPESEQLAMPVG
ncbi:phage holin family protein [Bremerella cremea]|uniref:phage holin family protein n=1 Tax=Bremerella cremea TaxID=1031537 RepID=UPI0031EC7929